MKRIALALALVSTFAFSASALSGKCATTNVSTNTTSISFGGSIKITGHFTACGNNGLPNTFVSIVVRNPCLTDASGGQGYNTLLRTYVDIPAGQTLDFTVTFTPPCNDESGNWEAETYMRPRGNTNFLEASTDFTVTP